MPRCPRGALQLTGLRASAQSLAWPLVEGAAPSPVRFAAQLTAPGSDEPARLEWDGRVGLTPMGARGSVLVERFPVASFAPYFAAALPVSVQRLEAGFKGEFDLRLADDKVAGQMQGEALLADLLINTKATPDGAEGSRLVRWNALAARPMRVELQPSSKPRVEVGELRLSDCESQLEIDEEGRFNLRTATGLVANASSPPAAASAPPGPAGAAPRTLAGSALARAPFDFVIDGIVVSNGSVDFRDRFIRPSYSARLSALNGRIRRLDSSSRDTATVELDGRVAGTGLIEIRGAVNPTAAPPALDLKARAHDIELPGLTPYSAKYAGYPIERGKLSVDVAYKIGPEGKLEATNRIVVNQLTLGPKTDSPDATKLPVRLAVSLLQDANGVIDIDLAVSGSLDDPRFSVVGLIWKVIVNLLTKALTSPFSLLAGGEGKDLSSVAFRPGTAQMADDGRQVLDRVVKALADRPGLMLTITGTADAGVEKADMQRAALDAWIVEEQRRDQARGLLGSTVADAPLPPLTAAERERLPKRIYDDTRLPDKPRNLIGVAKDVPPEQMQAMLEAAVSVDAAAERALAVRRGQVVRDALLAKGLASERAFLAEPKLGAKGADNAAFVPHAQLALSVK